MKLVSASLSTFSSCFRVDTAQLLLPQSKDVSISQSSTLQTLTITHESCSLLLILTPFFAFLSYHALRTQLSPSKTDKRRTRKKQTTTTEILYTVPISKISMTILTVGRRGQSERGKSLCPMNLHGWKSGRERERENSQL